MWYTVIVLLYWSIFVACEDMAYVKINGNEIIKHESNNNIEHFDHFGNYSFFDGEAVNFTCNKYNIDTALMSVHSDAYNIYTNIETSTIVAYKPDILWLYLKLTKENDGNYLQCNVTNDFKKQSTVIRTYLAIKRKNKDLGFLVNSLNVPETKSCNEKYCFEYQYFDGENVTVETIKDDNIYGNVSCDIPDRDPTPKPVYMFEKILHEIYSTMQVLCTWHKHGDVTKSILQFVPDKGVGHEGGPIIRGLSAGRIIAKFKPDKFTYNIVYDYKDDELLNIECTIVEQKNLTLNYDKKTIEQKINMNNGKASEKYKLKTGQKTGWITCYTVIYTEIWNVNRFIKTTQNKKTNIILVRRNYDVTKEISPDVKENPKEEPGNKKNKLVILVASALLVLCLIVIVGVIIVKFPKLRRNKPKLEAYETLPEHNKGPMPIPAQWQDVQYCTPSDSAPKNTDYAVPHHPNLDEMYAKPIRKNKTILKTNCNDGTYVNSVENQYTDMNGSSEMLTDPVKPSEVYCNVFESHYINCVHEYAEIIEPTCRHGPK